MSRSLTRISLVLVLLLSSEAWAIGLGDINLDSALNEPLRAEIELLSVTPEELGSLSVTLASSDTFERYGLDRPFYLQEIEFNVVGDADGAVVQVRSRNAITEPFLTFLVEATWSSGRLLREYTVLLDPPTYSPPTAQQAPAVEAPRRATPADSARIERAPQPVQPAPEPQPTYTAPPSPAPTPEYEPPAADAAPAPSYGPLYSTVTGGEYYVNRGDTLWGIASRLRPDSRLTMNQTMVAIFEANPEAFAGNINRLKAGATLRIPSADNVFQIADADAFTEVKRQNDEWRASIPTPDTGVADTSYDEPAYEEPAYDEPTAYDEPEATADAAQPTETTLELVPPDAEQPGVAYDDEFEATQPLTREQQIENRIAELEAADVPDQQSLIEIRDSELAALRQELANIRGEAFEPADDEIVSEAGDEAIVEDAGEPAIADEPAAEAERAPSETITRTARRDTPGLLEKLIGWATSTWALIAYALAGVAGLLFWFMRRGTAADDASAWEMVGPDEIAAGAMTVADDSTQSIAAPTSEEAIVVVEQDSGIRPAAEATFEGAIEDTFEETFEAPVQPEPAAAEETAAFDSLEDTFSSETAAHLDETDPLAEADFHMAYGLYDQAADLVNGALEVDPGNKALRSKLCEIYFVWGNRDSFVDAAANLKSVIGDSDAAEWDKIVIMGQQIAADHEMFAGAGVAGATEVVDLSFEADHGDSAVLDVDFGGSHGSDTDIVDLGAADTSSDASAIDFTLEEDFNKGLDATTEMQGLGEAEITIETPTIEQGFGDKGGTTELPALDAAAAGQDAEAAESSSDATAEINLDDLDLNVPGLAETEFADLDETGSNEAIDDLASTGETLEAGGTGDLTSTMELGPQEATRLNVAAGETAGTPSADTEATDENTMLEATGRAQTLSGEMGIETDTDVEADIGPEEATLLAPGYGDEEDTQIASDAETMLASLDDEDDFEYASTEALPSDVFAGGTGLHEASDTTVAVAGTDVDLDLDDLTAALKRSEIGNAGEPGDDATTEQPIPTLIDDTSEVETMELGPHQMSDDLHEARTMTEVGTKLDLARAYVDMGDPQGARSILEEVLDEGDDSQRQQAQQLLESLAS